jgi:hypothetical protein
MRESDRRIGAKHGAMETFVDQALRFVLLFYGLMLVLGPVALRLQFRHNAKVFPRPVSFEELPTEVRTFMQPKVEAIAVWGFDLVAYLNLGALASGTQAFMALLSNPHTNEWADVSYAVSPTKSRGYMEFITRCSEEVQVDTNTSATSPVLFPLPNYHVFRFPQVNDVFTLYRIHRMLVQENTNGHRPILPPRGQEVAELQRRLERFGPWQQARGYMYFDPTGKVYRLTWKGAIAGGWRSIWPMPLLRAWQMKKRSDAILRRIGVAQQQ